MDKGIKKSPVITPEVLEGLHDLQAKGSGLNGEINNAEHIVWSIYREQKLPTETEVLQLFSCLKAFSETIMTLQPE